MWATTGKQAYDGHMNLILGDVEETIHVVDINEENGQETVRVSVLPRRLTVRATKAVHTTAFQQALMRIQSRAGYGFGNKDQRQRAVLT